MKNIAFFFNLTRFCSIFQTSSQKYGRCLDSLKHIISEKIIKHFCVLGVQPVGRHFKPFDHRKMNPMADIQVY